MAMRKRTYSSVVLAALMLANSASGQVSPPSNDEYANRIVLTGTDSWFAGSLAGATVEPGEVTPAFVAGANQSAWWSWTPGESTTATIRICNPSKATLGSDALSVWALSSVASGQMIAGMAIDTRFPDLFLSFPAAAGTNYQIQLSGSDGATFQLQLVVANVPHIINQPQSQTVTAGDSALFMVISTGGSLLRYQWQFDGTNMPGENVPMLALEHVDSSRAGAYAVVISNATGAVTSQVANLWVTANDHVPLLAAIRVGASNTFGFSVLGEAGRRYRIQSSTNLSDWAAEESFPTPYLSGALQPRSVSVVFDSSGADLFTLSTMGQCKFFRATPFHAGDEVCSNRLKQWRFAGLLAAYEHHWPPNGWWNFADLVPYFKAGAPPTCPLSGTYFFGQLMMNPGCSLAAHIFEEP